MGVLEKDEDKCILKMRFTKDVQCMQQRRAISSAKKTMHVDVLNFN
jgi:hypothetical protein